MTRWSLLFSMASCAGMQFAEDTVHPPGPTSVLLRGVTRGPDGQPLGAAEVTVHSVVENSDVTVTSAADGTFQLAALRAGQYQLTAKAAGYATASATTVDVTDQQAATVDLPMAKSVVPGASQEESSGFFKRLVKAYLD